MNFKPTKSGGRRIQGTTDWGDFDIVTDKKGFPISGFPIDIKTPENAKASKKPPCPGCGGNKIEPPRTPEENEAILRDGL